MKTGATPPSGDFSHEERNKTLQVLLQSIDALSADFTPENLKRVRALFKDVSKVESEKNKNLKEQVEQFSQLLMSISVAENPQNEENQTPETDNPEKKSREISDVLGKILRSTG